MRSRWLWLLLLVPLGLVVWDIVSDGSWLLGAVFAIVVLAFAWWSYPHRGARTRHQDTFDPGGTRRDAVVIYWRPGCLYCAALRRRLGRSGRSATWVNIWTDKDAAAYVRSVNSGNETVPTVVIDGVAHTNPPADQVREHLVPAA